jgi:hypothetical protein
MRNDHRWFGRVALGLVAGGSLLLLSAVASAGDPPVEQFRNCVDSTDRVEIANFRTVCDEQYAADFRAGIVRPANPTDPNFDSFSTKCESVGRDAWVCMGVGGIVK